MCTPFVLVKNVVPACSFTLSLIIATSMTSRLLHKCNLIAFGTASPVTYGLLIHARHHCTSTSVCLKFPYCHLCCFAHAVLRVAKERTKWERSSFMNLLSTASFELTLKQF